MTNQELKDTLALKNNKIKERILREATYTDKQNYKLYYEFAKFLLDLNRKKDNKEIMHLLNEIIHNADNKKLIHKAKIKKVELLTSTNEYLYAEHILYNMLEENENDYKAIIALGKLKTKTYEFEIAKKCFKYALNCDDRDDRTDAYTNLIDLYIENEDYIQAFNYLDALINDQKCKKYDNYNNYTYARIYRGIGDYDKAIEYMDKVTGLHERYGLLVVEQLYLYNAVGDDEKVSDILEKMGAHQAPEKRIQYEEALMNIALKNNNNTQAEMHKNKMLTLKKSYLCNSNNKMM